MHMEFSHWPCVAGPKPDLPDIMTNWHHDIHFQLSPLPAANISAEMLAAEVTPGPLSITLSGRDICAVDVTD